MKLLSPLTAKGSFKRQIILTFVVGFFLLATAFTAYQFRSERTFLYRESTNETISLAQSLAASSRSWVLANDVAGLQEVVHAFQAHPDLRYAMVISPAGQLLAHSDTTKVGQYVTDAPSLALLKSAPMIKIMVDDETISDIAVPIMLDQRFIGWARLGQTRSVISGNLHKIMLSSMLFVLISVVLVLFAALLIANRLGYRIGKLMQVAEEVQSGNYSTRANISGEDEVAKLAVSLNHMLDVLARDDEQLRKASIYTRSLIEASLDPLVTISPQGKITDVNKATEEVTGRLRSELIGTDFSDYFTEPDRARQGYQQVFAQGFVTDYPLVLRRRDGHVTDVLYNASIYRDQAGEVLGVFAAARDITERKQAEFILRQSEEGLKEAQRLAHLGSWYLDIATNQVFWSEELYKMYGFDPALPPPVYTESMKLFAPESWEKLSTAIAQAVEIGTPYELELETVRKDGGRGWMLARGEQVRDERGVPVRVRGVAMDITERKHTEERIRQINERFSLSTHAARLGVWDWDLQKNELVWDDRMYELYGVKSENFAGAYEAWLQGIHPDDRAASDEISKQARRGERQYDTEFRVVWPDGSIHYLKAYGQFVRDADGKPVRMIGVNFDITESKRAENELREKEERLALATVNNGVGIWDWNLQTQEMIWDDSMYALYHMRREDFSGTEEAWRTSLHPDDLTRGDKEVEAAIAGVRPFNTEFRVVWPDGTVRYIKAVAKVFRDDKGAPLRMLGINMDITERKQAEEALFEAQQMFRTLVENSPDIITRYNRDCQRTYVNPTYLKVAHMSAQELLGSAPVQRSPLPADGATMLQNLLRNVLDGGMVETIDVKWPMADNIDHWYNIYAFPEFDREGHVVSVMTVSRDITERKLGEIRLRDSERAFRALSENSPDVIVRYDREGRRIYVNPEFERVNHVRAQDVLGKTPAELSTELKPKVEEFTNRLMAAMNSGTADKVDLAWVKDGKSICWFVRVVPEFDAEGKVVSALTIWSDISERKRAEEQLRELNNDFVTLLESTSDFIYFKDRESRIRFCSQTLADVTGHHSWHDMVGKHDLEVFPEDVARIYYEEELPIFREGRPLLNKTDPYHNVQGKLGWVNTNKWPVFADDKKTVVGIFGISRDITELKEAEDEIKALNRDLEKRVDERTAQLEAANKELEAFSYSVSHDLRTPLRAIDGFSHILLEDYAGKLDDEGTRLLKVVRDNTNRMGQLIDDILQFSRTGRLALAFTEIDMERLAHEVVEELKPMFVGGELQFEIDAIPSCTGDRAMMRQVFMNLLSNALKFTRHNASSIVHVGASIKENEITYYVKDNGVGFDMKYSDKLFGVFQRLHSMEEFEGTGIGLAIVKRIITRHGGRVWAEGKVNEGATIYFALPITEASHG